MRIFFLFFILLLTPAFTHAQSSPFQQTATSTFTFTSPDIDNSTNSNASFTIFKDLYPATTSQISNVSAATYNQPLKNLIISNYTSCTSNGTDSFSCDLEPLLSSSGDGTYWFRLQSDQVPQVSWYSLIRQNGSWSTSQPNLTWSNQNQNTRFISLTATTSATLSPPNADTVNLIATYYLDPTEINTQNQLFNPTHLELCLAPNPGSSFSCRTISPITTGTSTYSLEFNLDSFGNQLLDAKANFTNLGAILSDSLPNPFDQTYIYTTLQIFNDNEITALSTEAYAPAPQNNNTRTYKPCGFTDLIACAENAIIYLFVPSQSASDQIVTRLTETDIPLIENAVAAVSQFTAYSQTDSSDIVSPAYSLDLSLPQIGTTTMFSFDMLSSGMGDTANTFRLIAEVALYLGFLYMLIRSVDNMLTLQNSDRR